MPDNMDVLREKVETLDGSRQLGSKSKAAVRIDDLAGLLRIPEKLKSAKVTSTVTAADYNNLVDDVTMLHTRLRAVVAQLQGRLGR
jgi:hypothetical protein